MDNLPEDFLQELKLIKEEQFVHEYSKETFDEIFIPWFICNEKLTENLSKISSNYILSKFMLTYIKFISNDLQKKYQIPSLKSKDLTDEQKIKEIKLRISEIDEDPLIEWLIGEGTDKLIEILDMNNVNNFEKVIELGLIEDILLNALEQGESNFVEGYHFEISYQYQERLSEANLLKGSFQSASTLILQKNYNITVNIGDRANQKEKVFDAEYAVIDEDVRKGVVREIKKINSSKGD